MRKRKQNDLEKIREYEVFIKDAIHDMGTALDLQTAVTYKHIAEYYIDCIFAINYKRLTESKDDKNISDNN